VEPQVKFIISNGGMDGGIEELPESGVEPTAVQVDDGETGS